MNIVEARQLHEIGLAARAYYRGFHRLVMGVDELYRADLIPAEMCKSPLDPFPHGLANELCRELAKAHPPFASKITPYPRTYVGPSDFNLPEEEFLATVLRHPMAGWLVSLTESTLDPDATMILRHCGGKYLRLLMDGSVVERTHRMGHTDDGETFWEAISVYFDGA